MKNKKEYQAPELTVVSFKSECGYAQSLLSVTRIKFSSALAGGPSPISSQEGWSNDESNTFGLGW